MVLRLVAYLLQKNKITKQFMSWQTNQHVPINFIADSNEMLW